MDGGSVADVAVAPRPAPLPRPVLTQPRPFLTHRAQGGGEGTLMRNWPEGVWGLK